jgi:DNA (cytosine-5)-methyltransferase 3A
MTEPKFDLDVVLSLFDGISCGQEALRKAGISTRIYLASEIEKYPVMINSSLVSAQNRKRLYWTNIPEVKQPEDKGILLKDVLEDEVDETCLHTTKAKTYMDRKVSGGRNHWDFKHHSDTDNDKSAAVVANFHKGVPYNVLIDREPKICGRIVGRKINPETGKRDDYNPELKRKKRIEARLDEKSGTLTTVQTDNVLIVPEATKKGYTEIKDGDCFDATFINSKTRRGRNMKDKSNCLTAANYDYMRYEHPTYRKLTPIECERLQTLPDNYTEGVSNTQRYKALGNGWTVDVIVHILQGLKQQTKVVAA